MAWAARVARMPVPVANGSPHLVVLVVEDEPLLRCSIADSLRQAGYTVIESASGEEAIALSKSDTSIDIVFTDISLIGAATGWDVADCFRVDRPKVSVLYTSGKWIDRGRCVPRSAFVAKPYQHDEVVTTCQRLCAV
jgi:CheY-like chemotaxis protein